MDVVIASQNFHWFANTSALREINRVLVPSGTFGIFSVMRDYSVQEETYCSSLLGRVKTGLQHNDPKVVRWPLKETQVSAQGANRSNSPFRATETTIHSNWDRFTFISTFILDIPRYNFTIDSSIFFHTFLYISNKKKRLAACMGHLWFLLCYIGGLFWKSIRLLCFRFWYCHRQRPHKGVFSRLVQWDSEKTFLG